MPLLSIDDLYSSGCLVMRADSEWVYTFMRTCRRGPYEVDMDSRRRSLYDCYRNGVMLNLHGKETKRRHVHIDDSLMVGPNPDVSETTHDPR